MVFCKHIPFSPCSRCKRKSVCLLCATFYVSAVRSLPPHRAGFLHHCLLGSWQSKKHAHLARIIRRSSLNSVLYTARAFRPCALPGPRSPDGLPSAFKFRDFIGGYSCTPYVTISDETLRHTGPRARGEARTPPPASRAIQWRPNDAITFFSCPQQRDMSAADGLPALMRLHFRKPR